MLDWEPHGSSLSILVDEFTRLRRCGPTNLVIMETYKGSQGLVGIAT